VKASEFGFGIAYDDGTEYFQSILNSDYYDDDNSTEYVNSTKMSLDLNGLALPS
jgi:hypothetical protein